MGMVDKNHLKKVVLVSVIYVSLILLCISFLMTRKLVSLRPIYVFNIGMDILGMCAGYVLYISCIIDAQKNGANIRFFLHLINVVFLGLFTDACAWILDGIPKLRYLNIADNTIYYMCAPIGAYFFWMYTMEYLKLNKNIVKTIGKVVFIFLILTLGAIILNLFNGMYFTVDAAGVYSRSPKYLYSFIYSNTTMFAALIAVIIERKKLEMSQIVSFFIYVSIPLLISALTIGIYGISVAFSSLMMVLFFMYCMLNVTQGRDKAVADRELILASRIQEFSLPKDFPFMPEKKEFDLYASMTPAKDVGGDFYDFFMIDDDRIALVIADVSGKGIPAALVMMITKGLIKSQAFYAGDLTPDRIFFNVNNQLCEHNETDMFITAWIGIITLSTGKLEYANAGHENPALYRNGNKFELQIEKHSPPLASMENIKFKTGEITLEPGDIIYLYTDGVPEATNQDYELFGVDKMLEVLNKNSDKSVKDIDVAIRNSIDEFVGEAPQFDDITMLTFKYIGYIGA